MNPNDFPLLPRGLLEALDKAFPMRDPSIRDTHDTIMWRGGERQVVNFLREVEAAQAANFPMMPR